MNKIAIYLPSARLICLLALACSPLLVLGASGALRSQTNNVLDWLPSSFEETQRLFWFVERFGSDEVLVASWPGCDLDDERLDTVRAGLLAPVPALDGGADLPPLFGFVLTGRQTLHELTTAPLELPPEVAIERMRGWLLGPDRRTTCVMAFVSAAGGANREAAVERVYEVAAAAGVARNVIRVGGPTADSVAVNQASQRWTIELGFLCTLVGLGLAWLCLRSARLVSLLFLTAAFAWSLSLSLIYYRGVAMDAVLLMVPALVFVLAISGGVHLTNYLNDAARTGGPPQAPARALAAGWLPCALATVTTAIGLGALATSHVLPVHRFGIFAALGVLGTLAALLGLWPALAQLFVANAHRPSEPRRATEWWRCLHALSQRYHLLVVLLALAALPPLAYGISRLRTSVQMEDLLSENSQLIQDQRWLSERIGPLIPVEIVLRFPQSPPNDSRTMLNRALIVEQLRAQIAAWDQTGGAVAATTFAPVLPSAGGARQIMVRRAVAAHLNRHRDDFLEMGLLYDDPSEELWRISARISSSQIDYGTFLTHLNQRVEQFLSESHRNESQISAEICGGVPLIFMAQKQLMSDLARSFLAAFVFIAAIMALVMRGIRAGLVAMIPNVFPAIVAFGGMGLLGTAIDVGTMMTASVAMGIAVDDTLHFLVWFRRGHQQYRNRPQAIEYAFRHCGSGILQTTVICGLGITPFLASPFVPVSRFAGVMSVLLILALLADLVLLPALLTGPLGRAFAPARTPDAPG